jgi:hypothetical protein
MGGPMSRSRSGRASPSTESNPIFRRSDVIDDSGGRLGRHAGIAQPGLVGQAGPERDALRDFGFLRAVGYIIDVGLAVHGGQIRAGDAPSKPSPGVEARMAREIPRDEHAAAHERSDEHFHTMEKTGQRLHHAIALPIRSRRSENEVGLRA